MRDWSRMFSSVRGPIIPYHKKSLVYWPQGTVRCALEKFPCVITRFAVLFTV